MRSRFVFLFSESLICGAETAREQPPGHDSGADATTGDLLRQQAKTIAGEGTGSTCTGSTRTGDVSASPVENSPQAPHELA